MANFAYVVQAGSITGAARHLGVSASVLSDSVKTLETRAGEPLLERRRSGVVATPRGAAIAEEAEQVVAALDRALGDDADQGLEGHVRVSLPGEVADTWGIVALSTLQQTALGLSVTLFVEDKMQDHTRFARDLYLRVGPAEDYPNFRRLWAERVDVVQVASARLPGLDPNDCNDVEALPILKRDAGSVQSADARTRLAMARAGMGRVFCLEPSVRHDLAAGHLVQLLPKEDPHRVWAVAGTPHKRIAARTRHVADAFQRALLAVPDPSKAQERGG